MCFTSIINVFILPSLDLAFPSVGVVNMCVKASQILWNSNSKHYFVRSIREAIKWTSLHDTDYCGVVILLCLS